MPDRIRARAMLTGLLVVLTVAGIRAVGPGVHGTPPARPVIIVTGCVLEATLAILLVALRWRSRAGQSAGVSTPTQAIAPNSASAGPDQGPSRAPGSGDVGARLRPILSGILVTAMIAVPLATFVGTIGTWRNKRRLNLHLRPPHPPSGRFRAGQFGHTTAGVEVVVQDVLIAIVILAVIAAAVVAWRYHRPRRPRLPIGTADADDLTDTPADLARAVDSGRIALRQLDDARVAIIGCYLAMEESLAEAGAARAVAETPDELLARAVASGVVGAAPAGRLTALFYEARFSTHPLPPARRDEAAHALAELAATLPDQQDQPDQPDQPDQQDQPDQRAAGTRGTRR